jgi:hypothetical protein
MALPVVQESVGAASHFFTMNRNVRGIEISANHLRSIREVELLFPNYPQRTLHREIKGKLPKKGI